jgi:exodeoxyribonuclease VII small subunit
VSLPEAKKDFETNLKQLEEIVDKLERGELPLDEAIKLFQEGMGLSRLCTERLQGVEKEIAKLVAENEKFRLEPFGADDV